MAEEARRETGEVLIVTGMSGAGRSTAANALEDLGWYVVDNLPPQMLRPLLDLTELAAGVLPRVAVVVDVIRGVGVVVRGAQSGFVRAYALLLIGGFAALGLYFLIVSS